ncbi:butyrophilin subfamily 2 member A1-like [Brachyhypopomus gauderio]|uniref:butyrophilin subfamily 2 member A1-like n=1 Tax=Brachyhypopomus gauderio TaxID=698409 RepID=UPI004041576A
MYFLFEEDMQYTVFSNVMISATLLRWVWMFLLPTLCASFESFSVVVPQDPVTGLLGASVSLPCTLSKNIDTTPLEVRWYHPEMFDTPVLLYKNRQILESDADQQYWGRVSLLGGLEKGNVTLKLENLTLADRGDYICHVSSDSWYDKNKVSLQIKAVGSIPVLTVAKAEGDQLNITCHTHGWFPEPSVFWTDSDKKDLKHLSKVRFTTDSQGLVNVWSWLIIPPSESEWLSCSVGLSASNQERRESRVLPNISADAESVNGPIIVSFIALLLLCVTGFTVYCVLHQKGLIGTKQKRTQGTEETEQLNTSPVDTELQTQNDPHTTVSSAQTEKLEWNQLKKCKVNITLDINGNPAFFRTARNGTRLHCSKPKQSDDIRDDDKFFSLCKEKFSSGKQYWEVRMSHKPKEKLSWYVGVASDTAERNYKTPLIPENGFWVLCYEKEENVYFKDPFLVLLTDVSETLTTVGVFLDCDEHTLSFYNVDAQSHLYTITNVKAKTLCPLISPGLRDSKPIHIINCDK